MAHRRMSGGYGNRNYGGGGGGPGQGYNSSVNPWQGGNVPGNQFGGGGNNMMLEPQAIAFALSKILQTQQVPSLLSMNATPPMQNQNRGFGNSRNFGRGNSMAMRRQQGSKVTKMSNRTDAFKSNQSNRRQNNNRNQQKNNSKNAKPQRTGANESKDSKNKSSAAKASSAKSQEAKKSVKDTTDETCDDNAPETSDKHDDSKSEDVETKRDWKEEKNETDDKGEENEIIKVKKESNEENESANEDSDGKDPEADGGADADKSKSSQSPYEGIPKEYFFCYICQKRMWDAKSFDNHMKGRAHQQVCEKVDDTYRIKADMMRESVRLAEEKNNIEFERQKRLGKKTKNLQLSRCAMCDLEFHGQLFVHRKSPGHQRLKEFLHPKCTACNKEFPTRMEWDHHRHTPEHLRKRAQVEKNGGGGSGSGSAGAAATTNKKPLNEDELDDEELFLDEESLIVLDSALGEEDDGGDENAVTDLTTDMEVDNIQLPTYRANRPVGVSLIKPAVGFSCRPCGKFFLTEEASQAHTRSRQHFDSFISIMNERVAEHEEKKRKAATSEEDDEGNWKRRRTNDEKGAENGVVKVEQDDEEQKNNGDELYDPMECENEEYKNNSTNNSSLQLDASDAVNDPNDICLNDSQEETVVNDANWKDVDGVADDTADKKSTELVAPPAPTISNTSPKSKTPQRPQRATRGRRHY